MRAKLPIGCGMHRARRNRHRPGRTAKPLTLRSVELGSDNFVHITVKVGCPHVAQAGFGIRKQIVSCMSNEEFAVARVAAKYFDCSESDVVVRRMRTGDQCAQPPVKSLWIARKKGGAS